MSRSAHGGRPPELAQCGIALSGRRGVRSLSATEEAVSPKGVADLLETDDTKALLEAGREAGHLSADEIAVALDELDLEPNQIDDFYHAL